MLAFIFQDSFLVQRVHLAGASIHLPSVYIHLAGAGLYLQSIWFEATQCIAQKRDICAGEDGEAILCLCPPLLFAPVTPVSFYSSRVKILAPLDDEGFLIDAYFVRNSLVALLEALLCERSSNMFFFI